MQRLYDHTQVVQGCCRKSVCCYLNFIIIDLLDTFDIRYFFAFSCSSLLLYQIFCSKIGNVLIKVCFISICGSKCLVICAILICNIVKDGIPILIICRVILILCVKHYKEFSCTVHLVILFIRLPVTFSPVVFRRKQRHDQV